MFMRQKSRSSSPRRLPRSESDGEVMSVSTLGSGSRWRWHQGDGLPPASSEAGGADSEGHSNSKALPRDGGWDRSAMLADEDAPKFTPTVVMQGTHPVRAVAFSPDGWLFAAGSNNRALRVCRAPTEQDLWGAAKVVDEQGGLSV
ncbi:unnamed protein product, partial [Sphacelaria rigidula]